MKVLLWIHTALAAALLWSCFCRASVTSKRNTVAPVRWAFALLMAAAVVAFVAPYVWAWTPNYVSVLLLAGITAVQVTTAAYWGNGVPESFRPKEARHG